MAIEKTNSLSTVERLIQAVMQQYGFKRKQAEEIVNDSLGHFSVYPSIKKDVMESARVIYVYC